MPQTAKGDAPRERSRDRWIGRGGAVKLVGCDGFPWEGPTQELPIRRRRRGSWCLLMAPPPPRPGATSNGGMYGGRTVGVACGGGADRVTRTLCVPTMVASWRLEYEAYLVLEAPQG
eukprot:4472295-Prymnesium_polylepis.2